LEKSVSLYVCLSAINLIRMQTNISSLLLAKSQYVALKEKKSQYVIVI